MATAQLNSAGALKPRPNESCEQYTVRAHSMLVKSIPDPDRRNSLVQRYWRKFRGLTDEERLAHQCFSTDRYEHKPNVCVFMEHEAPQEDGTIRRFDLKELAGIVRHNNERIADTGAFSAISDGHTSLPDDPNQREPDVLGFSGPFRLGMVGRKKPKWAIFADEHHLKSAAPILQHKPRRSVEVITYTDSGRTHFDPIAALGASAPRLPLPVQFSTYRQEGVTVQRYSALSVPAYPGGSNTFVKGPGTKQKPKATTTSCYQENPTMLAPEDKAELLDALSSLPQFKFLDQLMNSPQLQAMLEPAADPGLDAGGGDEDALPEADDAGEIDVDLGDDLAGDGSGAPPPPAPDKKEDEYMARYAAKNDPKVTVQQYAALQKSHAKLIREHGALHNRLQAMEQKSVDAERRLRINQLAEEYPHFVDADEECQTTLYSLGANMSDEDFEKHVAKVERYAQKSAPATRMIPRGEIPAERQTRSDYAAKRSEVAVRIATKAAERGKPMDWETACAEADKELKAAG